MCICTSKQKMRTNKKVPYVLCIPVPDHKRPLVKIITSKCSISSLETTTYKQIIDLLLDVGVKSKNPTTFFELYQEYIKLCGYMQNEFSIMYFVDDCWKQQKINDAKFVSLFVKMQAKTNNNNDE